MENILYLHKIKFRAKDARSAAISMDTVTEKPAVMRGSVAHLYSLCPHNL